MSALDGTAPVEPPQPGSVFATVIPCFRPSVAELEQACMRMKEFGLVVLVDDSGDEVNALDTLGSVAEIVVMPSNSGIGAALNAGVSRAIGLGAQVVMTLDQDSLPDSAYVAAAVALVADPGRDYPVVVPARIGPGPEAVDGGQLQARWPIQSGMVIAASAFAEVGSFDESMFIDSIDVDFVIRLRAAGRAPVALDTGYVSHRLGTVGSLRSPVGGRTLQYTWHSPTRRYYIFRNRVRLLQKHGARYLMPGVAGLAREVRSLCACLAGGPERRPSLSAAVRGLWDGLTRVEGRIPEQHLAAIDK
ncbi:glycosyltransferase [Cellulomonas sp. Root137]|uniref:glycosyltransferase n=1 Tax=Cellulomonas sp. Root137 TaxID=1736459 RepID=UPI0006FBABBC|nr:glycosyltransferase [Cellulomonas sp. Root137]KQY42818.1 hypothetical protein ASD18_17665 [Cellulomonas sp. Root137]